MPGCNQVLQQMNNIIKIQERNRKTDNKEKFSYLNNEIIRCGFKIIMLSMCKKIKAQSHNFVREIDTMEKIKNGQYRTEIKHKQLKLNVVTKC